MKHDWTNNLNVFHDFENFNFSKKSFFLDYDSFFNQSKQVNFFGKLWLIARRRKNHFW